jgi:hypothetical protein
MLLDCCLNWFMKKNRTRKSRVRLPLSRQVFIHSTYIRRIRQGLFQLRSINRILTSLSGLPIPCNRKNSFLIILILRNLFVMPISRISLANITIEFSCNKRQLKSSAPCRPFSWKYHQIFGRRVFLWNFSYSTFSAYICQEKQNFSRIYKSFKSANKLGQQITNTQITKNIGSANRKSANCTICRWPANLSNLCPQNWQICALRNLLADCPPLERLCINFV